MNIFSLAYLLCKEKNFALWLELFFKTQGLRGSRNYALRGCILNKMVLDEEGERSANNYILILRYAEVYRNTIQDPYSWNVEYVFRPVCPERKFR